MATQSRYASPSANANQNQDVRTGGVSNTNTNTNSGSISQGQQNTSSNGTQTTTSNSTTRNMSPQSEGILNTLLNQLLNGGTAEMRADRTARLNERTAVSNAREGYSKANAFIDAQGLINQTMRRTMEQLAPSINAAAEGAGSSGGALRALLMQDVAQRAAESGSAQGVQTAVQYGNISANLSQVLERLTQQDPTAANLLIQALNVAKGATTETSGSQTTTTQNNQLTTNQNVQAQTGNQNQTTVDNKTVDYAPFQTSTSPVIAAGVDNPIDPRTYVGSSAYNMSQLRGEGNPWASYTF